MQPRATECPANGANATRKATQSSEPLIRWAGGKRQILTTLLRFLPGDYCLRKYHEPFAGGACLFFHLRPKSAVLADANPHLISCYRFLRTDAALISREIAKHRRSTSEDYYYSIRDIYNRSEPSATQAARFIYLNKTCFNGIFRVNRSNEFNVPYGWKEPPCLPTSNDVAIAGKALRRARLLAKPFTESLGLVRRGDFVYRDPPYPALNGTSYFAHYTADRFAAANQEQLAAVVKDLDARGALFLMSNADTPLIRRLYAQFQIHALDVIRYITCKSEKHRVSELVITNYTAPAAVVSNA